MCDRASTETKEAFKETSPYTVIHVNANMKEEENEFFQSLECSKTSFLNKSLSKKSEYPPKQQLKSIIAKKRQTLAALMTYEHQEQNIRAQMKQLKINSRQQHKSQFFKEDSNLVKQLIRQSQLFQSRMQKRVKSIQEQAQRQKSQQKQQQIDKIKNLKQLRHKQALERIKHIQKRQKQRQIYKQKSLERQNQLKDKIYIFQKFKTIQDIPRSRQVSSKKKINMSDIFQHEKKYRSITEEQNKARKDRMLERKKQFQKLSSKKYPERQIVSLLKKQNQDQRRKDYEKLNFPDKCSNRMSQYGKIVRQLYYPHPRRQKTQTDPSINNTKGRIHKPQASRSISELKQLGDNYLIYNKKQGVRKGVQAVNESPCKELKPTYKNYWKQVRQTTVIKSFNIRFSRLMRQQNSPDKIFRLKSLLAQEQRKFPYPDEEKLKQLTDAKFLIINSFL